MNHPYGPWATPISAGQNPQLSAFWRRRMGRLAAVSQATSALSRRNAGLLIAMALLFRALPTLQCPTAWAEPTASAEKSAQPTAPASAVKSAADLLREFKELKWKWERTEIVKKIIAKGDKSVVPEIARMLASDDRRLRCDAGWVLSELGDERGLPVVIAELTDASDRPTERIRSNGARYVEGQIKDDHWYAACVLEKIRDPRAISALIKALEDPDVSMEAGIALAHNNNERAAPALLAALERAKADGQPRGQVDMRFWAGYGLLGLRDPQGTKTMVGFLNGEHYVAYQLPANADAQFRQLCAEGNAMMRRTAAEAFIEFPDKVAVPALLRATVDKDISVRVNAIAALGRVGDEAALPTLRVLLSDSGKETGNVHISYDPPKFVRMTLREAARGAIDEINRLQEKK
jgi:HEAT repeat protein